MDALLWNGEYYVQRLEDVNAFRYQYGDGCLQTNCSAKLACTGSRTWSGSSRGNNVRTAIAAVYKHNFS